MIRAFPLRAPRRIGGQIALLVVAALIVVHVLAGMTFVLLRGEGPRPEDHPEGPLLRAATMIRLLDAADPADRERIVAAANVGDPAIHLAPIAPEALVAPGSRTRDHPAVSNLRRMVRPLVVVERPHGRGDAGSIPVAVGRPGGFAVAADLPAERPMPPRMFAPLVMSLLVTALAVGALSLWAAFALSRPLEQLSEAAEQFGRTTEFTPLPSRGPEEVLAASRALERMRSRVTRLLDDRTHMLAAISHDLRTPMTRLRLRAEFMEDEGARASTLRDLDQMNRMVEAALAFVRDGRACAPTFPVDLGALARTVCDMFEDAGGRVSYEGPDRLVTLGAPDDLQRALSNLVDNGVKYGGAVIVRLSREGDEAVLQVADDGAGIPDGLKARLLEPFVRGDSARSQNGAGGFGLGLTIARAIVEAHGGTIALSDGRPSGLVVRFALPIRRRTDTRPGESADAPATVGQPA